MKPGDRLTLTVERPAAGGRMIARHDGAIVLVSAVIPGETVEAEVEKMQRGTIWARPTRILQRSADRVAPEGDWRCGGNVFAHMSYDRQLAIKREIVRDAFTRIGRMTTPEHLPVIGSAVDGYRMRARLHVQGARVGFFREGTHQLCAAGPTRQLQPDTVESLERLAAALESHQPARISELEVSESCDAGQRVVHLEIAEAADPARLGPLPRVPGVTGASCGHATGDQAVTLWGVPSVTETLLVPALSGTFGVTLTRHARAFFQANRFLLTTLVAAVVDAVPDGRTLDLYAGVGLFSAAIANHGGDVIAIEGDRTTADDLKRNAAVARGSIDARHQSVETFLATEGPAGVTCVLVDPPRTGMSKEALTRAIGLGAPRLVYVSCDVATLGRDGRVLADNGYRLTALQMLDLFPNTAHVESVAVFER